jgi:radical SAM superfamily enzyme YgiQ (UPF0313 family)
LAAGWNRLFFTDNTFNLPPSWAKAFCRELIQRSLKPTWRVILHPGRVDEELAQGLAEAGCVEVSLGFESGSDRILARLGKHFTAQHVRRARAALKQAGIRTMGFLMLGVPGETRETVQESLDFVEAVRPDAVRLTVGVRIYPQTPLANWARDRGVVGPDDDLLRPRFYLEPGLKEWLWETAHAYAAGRPWCIGP